MKGGWMKHAAGMGQQGFYLPQCLCYHLPCVRLVTFLSHLTSPRFPIHFPPALGLSVTRRTSWQ